jgi:antitoxin MazE
MVSNKPLYLSRTVSFSPAARREACISNVDTAKGIMYLHCRFAVEGLALRSTIKKWGNSAAVRMPASLMEEARLHIDQPVDVHVEKGRIVIEPISSFDLDSLLAEITEDNLHDEVDFGRPVGREVL